MAVLAPGVTWERVMSPLPARCERRWEYWCFARQHEDDLLRRARARAAREAQEGTVSR